ncbi:[FeFe] hydrogenase H-cluster maturation GTPase HydF [candidate division NPL-UPA2 bacterium]|nr:[FeFe] hydrogenase H-cluster maturation GTPase HydF [candidate division NPL-UPA2 bacterium]
MQKTPKGLRLHIAVFGRKNVGKSSVLNALTQQDVSIVSEVAGTTTDPVEKAMELLPIGPVLFIDTAGIDDIGSLGALRVRKTYQVFERADIVILVTEANVWGEYEEKIVQEAKNRKIPLLVILNKIDLFAAEKKVKERLDKEKTPYGEICARPDLSRGWEVTAKIKSKLVEILPDDWLNPPSIIADLVKMGEVAILVIPIDKEAPKGRIILPQVQTIREVLDKGASALIVSEKELPSAINSLRKKPAIVVTDSQAFEEVFASLAEDIPLTSFSILFARCKGDLRELVKGAEALGTLNSGDKVLIAEACTHHPIGEDIGRIKIPHWINQKIGSKISFEVVSGHDFPEDLKQYKLIIQCGCCVFNRREVLSRIYRAKSQGVPITNYGLAIAYLFGNLERAIKNL